MIHKSWKRIEILNIIDTLGLDIKQYSYLHKKECNIKFTEYIKLNNLTNYFYLFKTKPPSSMSQHERSKLTKKATKIKTYCETLDLEFSKYNNINEIKADINMIKNSQQISCIRKAIEMWNTMHDFELPVPYLNEQLEHEVSLEQEKTLVNKINHLSVKRGEFLIDFN